MQEGSNIIKNLADVICERSLRKIERSRPIKSLPFFLQCYHLPFLFASLLKLDRVFLGGFFVEIKLYHRQLQILQIAETRKAEQSVENKMQLYKMNMECVVEKNGRKEGCFLINKLI